MKSKIMTVLFITSVLPHLIAIISGLFTVITEELIFTKYVFLGFYFGYAYIVYLFSVVVPIMPVCIAFHTGVVVYFILKNIKVKDIISKIISFIIDVFDNLKLKIINTTNKRNP